MVLPALTLVVGIIVGALIGSAGKTPTAASTSPSQSAVTTTASQGVAVAVPPECLQLATDASSALPALGDVTNALKSLDIGRLQQLIGQLSATAPHLQDLANACRSKAGSVQVVPSPAAS